MRKTTTLLLLLAAFCATARTFDPHRISVFGSSVARGEGAPDHHGYAAMLADALSDTPFSVSGISVNGNNTRNLLARYTDLTADSSRYVVLGVSLGNEGIHRTDGARDSVFAQFALNMRTLIDSARADGHIPVVMNNYTRGDFDAADYACVKAMNMFIHSWDVASVNLLGAIDNGAGRWADGYQNGSDIYHPSGEGHRELFLAIPPSLFHALSLGKPLPPRVRGHMQLPAGSAVDFTPDGLVHPFTLALTLGSLPAAGRVTTIRRADGSTASLDMDPDSTLIYTAPGGYTATVRLSGTGPHTVALTHYHAQGRTILYADGASSAPLSEKIEPTAFSIGGDNPLSLCEIFFYRSGMNALELDALSSGAMLRSSLDLYLAPTPARPLHNLAQSTLTATITHH